MKRKETAQVGVIGGSGLYDIPGLKEVREARVKTPFGDPSDALVLGTLDGVRCAFLPRHGRGHRILPGEINQRANLWALKSLGVQQVVSVAAVGSLKEELAPRDFVFPDQLVDRTSGRVQTFFGGGIVGHVAFAKPYCGGLAGLLHGAAKGLGIRAQQGGTYVCMEGPLFSTKAESEFHRRNGWDVIGMTACPEAKLAREAELCYASVCMVTDYDCWKEGEEVTQDLVLRHLLENVADARRLLAASVRAVAGRERACGCGSALKDSILTDMKLVPPATRRRLDLLIGRYAKR